MSVFYPEAVAANLRCDWNYSRHPDGANRARSKHQLSLLLLAPEQSPGGKDGEGSEGVDHPVEAADEEYSRRDEQRAHHERSEHFPDKHALTDGRAGAE